MKIFIGDAKDILNKFDNDISCFHVKLFKEESKAAFVLLKYVLQKEGYQTDYYVKYTEYKKPYIKGIFYNVSHSKGKIALAIGENEVGVDIQKYVDTIERTKPKYYHDLDYIKNPLHMWVIKESYLKFIGVGLRNDLQQIRINKETVKHEEFEEAYYHLFDLGDDYAIALCSDKKEIVEIINV